MEQRISLVTLGVADMDRSSAFYDALGWQRVDGQEGIVVYDLIAQTLALYPLARLAEDIGVPVADLGHGATTLAHNLRDKAGVAALLARADAAGGKVLKPAQDVFWGGHVGYFADPDGHFWEIAWNPAAPLRPDDGAFRWRGYGEGG